MDRAMAGTAYENRLQKEIETLGKRIRELEAERAALERQLIKARRETAGVSDVSRLNSVNRVMIERRIIAALQVKSPLTNRALFAEASQVTFDLNANTFRTHLHRMKSRGLIASAGRNGLWELPRSQQKPSKPPNTFG